MALKENDIVVFVESHKWCGSIGFVDEVKNNFVRVAVPVPVEGIAYINATYEEIEYTGGFYPFKVSTEEE